MLKSNSSLYLYSVFGVDTIAIDVTVSFTFTLYVVVLLIPFSSNVTVNGKFVASTELLNPVTDTLLSFKAIASGSPTALVTKISP